MEKKIFVLIAAAGLLNLQLANAQGKAYDMMVNGVKVIVQPSGNDIVEVETVIKGGVQNYPADKAGIEALAMNALTECGTLRHDKNAFKDQLDKLGATVYGACGKDYSLIRMNCVKPDFDNVWALYQEAITIPKFDEKEFLRIRQDAINSLKEQDSQPDAAIDKYADKVAFAGRPYAQDPYGTIENVSKLTVEQTKAYYQSILTKSRMVIVVVGDLDKSVIEQKVSQLLGTMKQGAPYELKKSFFRVYKNSFSSEDRGLATNYIEGITSGPEPGTDDYNAFNVAMRIFADRHFLYIRTKNGLSYAPQAWFSSGSTAVAKFSVSTTEPNKYIDVFDKLVDTIKMEGFKPDEVADMKMTYLTGFYYRQETNQAQASSMAANEVLFNNWRRALTLVDDVKKLTTEQVNDAFRKYITNIVWVYQGDTKKVTAQNFINGVNKGGNPVAQ
ncbi:MAG: insulinase family protein [Bacteroidetes bacterium]|nr:insulinase family protein [Bacteroidota bacterium]